MAVPLGIAEGTRSSWVFFIYPPPALSSCISEKSVSHRLQAVKGFATCYYFNLTSHLLKEFKVQNTENLYQVILGCSFFLHLSLKNI